MSAIHLILFAIGAAPGTWTVDDDGPADFADLPSAVAATPAGDVILVEPGTYSAFHLTKRITMLGRGTQRPLVRDVSHVGAGTGFTLAGLEFQDLVVEGVAERGRIDSCTFGIALPSWGDQALAIEYCAEIEVSQCAAAGRSARNNDSEPGMPAVSVTSSRAVFVDCTFRGGDGAVITKGSGSGTNGGAGLAISAGSAVQLIGSPLVTGGASGDGKCSGFCTSFGGTSGHGIHMQDSLLFVRGVTSDTIKAGPIGTSGENVDLPGNNIHAAASTIIASGVTLGCCGAFVSGYFDYLPVAEPTLEARSQDGLAWTIELRGPSGATGFLLASLDADLVTLPGYGAPLWLALPPLLVAPIVTSGQTSPVQIPLTVPLVPGVEALALELQAVFPGIADGVQPNKSFVSNPAVVIPRT